MSDKNNTCFIGSHARRAITDWHTIAKLIQKHSIQIKERTQKETTESENKTLNVLNEREVHDAFTGPLQSFFQVKCATYAKIALLRMALNLQDDEMMKSGLETMITQNKLQVSEIQKYSKTDLNKMQKTLDTLAEEHYKEWETLRHTWNEQLILRLKESGLTLNEIEVKEFTDPEPISELKDRFISLTIPLPKSNKKETDFANYLRLKTTIAIQSNLSRNHLSHDAAEIEKVLKALKVDFNDISKQEQSVIDQQTQATQACLTPS